MFDRQNIGEPRADGAGHRVQGFAGGVRHQMDMEIGGEARREPLALAAMSQTLLWIIR